MSNRNFDSRVVIQRLQNQNYARNLYQMNTTGNTLITNPQNSDGTASRLTTFSAGSQTQYFRGLLGAGESVSLGGISDLIVTATAPSRPTITQITAGNEQLVVAFSVNSGGSPITNIQYSVNNGVFYTSAGTTTSPITITGLTNGVAYQVVIRAVNSVGTSSPSTMVEATPSTVPAAPTDLSGVGGNQEITVTFSVDDGGSPITNYQYSTDNGATYVAFSPADTSSPVVITTLSANSGGLVNNTAYTVRLKAVNANGVSVESASISVTPALVAVPPAPTALSGVGGDRAIYVLFTQSGVGGGPITNYEYSVDGGAYVACSPAQTFSPVLITTTDGSTLLDNGTSYTVTLKAVNGGGTSVASASTSVTPSTNSLLGTSLLVELDANNSSSYSGSGATWTNLRSSGSYSASLQNNPAFDGTNKYFTFDGTNQVAQIAAATAINPTAPSAFTVQIWARINRSSPPFQGGDGLISKQYGSGSDYDGYSLGLNNATGAVILNMNGQSVNGNYGSAAGVYNGDWALYTIVVRFGGGSGNPSYTYVNGRRVVTAPNGESSIPSHAPLQFPRGFQEGSANFCPADVGAFYLYDAAVSQEDIIRNYDATKARYAAL